VRCAARRAITPHRAESPGRSRTGADEDTRDEDDLLLTAEDVADIRETLAPVEVVDTEAARQSLRADAVRQ
jgi:hypothetical protein